jgi:hypothetical protein
MTASLSILRSGAAPEVTAEEAAEREIIEDQQTQSWNPQRFAHDQIRNLVRRVFLQGWPRPARQVVFSTIHSRMHLSRICRTAGEILAADGGGRVALVEADLGTRPSQESFGRTSNDGSGYAETAGAVRKSSRQIAHNLWLVPAGVFLGCRENEHNAAWLCSRLGELRREFDFAVIHASSAESGSATFLGHLADGLILALDAHRTRRRTALKIREHMVGANVRLLGVVLCERSFPIPEQLYRRL